MKMEYILIFLFALGALAFLGTTFFEFGEDAATAAGDAKGIIDDIAGSSGSGN